MAVELGIDPLLEAGLLWIAEDALDSSRLPDGWAAHVDAGSGRTYYARQATGDAGATSVWEHPLGDFYRGAVFMARGGRQELEAAARQQPATDDEVASMAEYLGLGPDEPAGVLEVARLAVSAPLPPDWEEVEAEADEDTLVFTRLSDGHRQDAHPLDAYFAELVRRRRRKAREEDPLLERRRAILRKLAQM